MMNLTKGYSHTLVNMVMAPRDTLQVSTLRLLELTRLGHILLVHTLQEHILNKVILNKVILHKVIRRKATRRQVTLLVEVTHQLDIPVHLLHISQDMVAWEQC